MVAVLNVPIVQRRQIYDNIVEVTCHLDKNVFSFKPGQYIQVSLHSLSFSDSKGNSRTFNILSSPNNTEYISFAFHNSDSAFKKSINELPINSDIQIKGPFGVFTLPAENKKLVLLSEEIGIVPFISMLLYVTEEKLQNKITLIHSGKNKIPYLDTVQEIEKINPNLSIMVSSDLIDSKVIKNTISDFDNSLFYVAGMPQTIRRIKTTLLQNNVPQINIHTEEFAGY